MKTKFQFYRLNRPNCYGRTSLEGRDDTQAIIPWSNTEGDISYNHPLYDFAPWFSKQMPSVPEAVRAEAFKCKVQIARPAEGPGKILKYRSNLRLYPVDFGNKLCILIFIILSIGPNFFDPPHLLLKTFWCPPLLATQNFFGPPPFCPAPHQGIYEHSLMLT